MVNRRIILIFISLTCILSLSFTATVFPAYQAGPAFHQTKEIIKSKSLQENTDHGWYYLPAYPNYAPNGLPDFDQRQNTTWKRGFIWSFCGPVALANVFWWFDSKHESQEGVPGDGIDDYPLVRNYNTYSEPYPGPSFDDHNFNNVNDFSTDWNQDEDNGELIERLATYVDIYWHKIPFIGIPGTDKYQLVKGARRWIREAGLKDEYEIEIISKPSFPLIIDLVKQHKGVILHGGYYIPRFPKFITLISGHFFAVAGVHPDGYIAISDSFYDVTHPTNDYTLHNDPQYVSHDIIEISTDTPLPSLSKWWIPSFQRFRRVIIRSAIVISETEQTEKLS